jgi:hypothetical protein
MVRPRTERKDELHPGLSGCSTEQIVPRGVHGSRSCMTAPVDTTRTPPPGSHPSSSSLSCADGGGVSRRCRARRRGSCNTGGFSPARRRSRTWRTESRSPSRTATRSRSTSVGSADGARSRPGPVSPIANASTATKLSEASDLSTWSSHGAAGITSTRWSNARSPAPDRQPRCRFRAFDSGGEQSSTHNFDNLDVVPSDVTVPVM